MIRVLAAALLLAAACDDEAGGSGGGGGSGPGTRETWVAKQLTLPTSSTVSSQLAFDLDGDGIPDDRLGQSLSALVQAGGFDLQRGVDDAVLSGSLIQLVETHTGAATSIAFHDGTTDVMACSNPEDPNTCGRHLDGSTTFTASAPADPALEGSGTAAAFEVGPGAVTLRAAIFGAPRPVPLVRARASFTRAGAELHGRVGGAIPGSQLSAVVYEDLHDTAEQAIARDCTGGACVHGSTGEAMQQIFDADHDGAVTLAELQTNPILSTVLAPDVDTDGDGTADAMSVAFGYELVGAVF